MWNVKKDTWQEYGNFLNLWAAELFASIFHSFEAGIANTISSFKRMKNIFFYET